MSKFGEGVIAAENFAESMIPKKDGDLGSYPAWCGWALREAFIAGVGWAHKERGEEVPQSDNATKLYMYGSDGKWVPIVAEAEFLSALNGIHQRLLALETPPHFIPREGEPGTCAPGRIIPITNLGPENLSSENPK